MKCNNKNKIYSNLVTLRPRRDAINAKENFFECAISEFRLEYVSHTRTHKINPFICFNCSNF